MKKPFLASCCLALTLLVPLPGHGEDSFLAPPPAPPVVLHPASPGEVKSSTAKAGAVKTEWTFHKSTDGAHPDGTEQQLMWLMNRARANPTAEGIWLASETDPDVAGGRTYFHVKLDVLRSEFANLAAKPPAVFDIRLYNAALAHSQDLIARNAQDHTNQFQRIDNAGFHYTRARGNVFSYAKSALNAHAGFNIDWGGDDGTGMQNPRGHRLAIMAADGDYTNVGIAAVAEQDPNTRVGPLVITGNYCKANTNYTDHFNTFLVGTVWRDDNDNNQYDPGEGLAGVRITPSNGSHYAVTGSAGGYGVPVPDGASTVIFQGGALAGEVSRQVNVDQESVLVDLKVGEELQRRSNTFPWPLFLPALMTKSGPHPQPDCNGTLGGTARIDHCGVCVEGTTGRTACIQDCRGVWGGDAVLDRCGVCGGDGTSCVSFTRNSSGKIITDQRTHLMWQDSPLAFKDEAGGITHCSQFTLEGYDDWRLPTFAELQNFFRDVDADPNFDLHYWGTFSGCTASVAVGGYVKTPAGTDRYGGKVGDRIYFSGGAAARCVRP